MNQTNAPECQKSSAAEKTVEEALDGEIAGTRARLERLCIVKAKADASGLLKFPVSFIQTIAYMS